MIKEIVKDNFFLSLKSSDATQEDLYIVQDLKDTLTYNKNRCVGIAANMIGYSKRIIIVDDNGKQLIMINPIYLKVSDPYQTEEGCLSHDGVKPCTRYKKVKVQYLDEQMKIKIKTYTDFTAQIIQHEMDHLEGILI